MTQVYRNAFEEVYVIINYLEDDDYNKIPKEVIHGIELNRNKKYEYFLDETIPFEEQKMLPETRAILFNFFRDYLSTKEQKEKIVSFQRNQRIKLEEEKKKKYDIDVFRKKEIKENADNITKETALIKLKEKKFYIKIIEFIKRILKNNK